MINANWKRKMILVCFGFSPLVPFMIFAIQQDIDCSIMTDSVDRLRYDNLTLNRWIDTYPHSNSNTMPMPMPLCTILLDAIFRLIHRYDGKIILEYREDVPQNIAEHPMAQPFSGEHNLAPYRLNFSIHSQREEALNCSTQRNVQFPENMHETVATCAKAKNEPAPEELVMMVAYHLCEMTSDKFNQSIDRFNETIMKIIDHNLAMNDIDAKLHDDYQQLYHSLIAVATIGLAVIVYDCVKHYCRGRENGTPAPPDQRSSLIGHDDLEHPNEIAQRENTLTINYDDNRNIISTHA